jgi:hypothetical protein
VLLVALSASLSAQLAKDHDGPEPLIVDRVDQIALRDVTLDRADKDRCFPVDVVGPR